MASRVSLLLDALKRSFEGMKKVEFRVPVGCGKTEFMVRAAETLEANRALICADQKMVPYLRKKADELKLSNVRIVPCAQLSMKKGVQLLQDSGADLIIVERADFPNPLHARYERLVDYLEMTGARMLVLT